MPLGHDDPPSARGGWPRTLLKCGLGTLTTALLGAGLMALLLWWLPAPWWLPKAVLDWLRLTLGPYALGLGAFLGALLGLPLSAGIILWDARKGRLSKVT